MRWLDPKDDPDDDVSVSESEFDDELESEEKLSSANLDDELKAESDELDDEELEEEFDVERDNDRLVLVLLTWGFLSGIFLLL